MNYHSPYELRNLIKMLLLESSLWNIFSTPMTLLHICVLYSEFMIDAKSFGCAHIKSICDRIPIKGNASSIMIVACCNNHLSEASDP